MRRILAEVAFLAAAAAAPAAGGTFPWGGGGPTREPNPATVALRDYTATIRTNLGEITLDLQPDAAPNAVRMFLKLAARGAYGGARFQCVFKDRMLVVGTPFAKGKEDEGETIPYEESPLPATSGAVMMDKTPDGQNCPGRLLIALGDQSYMDRSYTVFAEISKGLDVAKRIGGVAVRPNDGSPAPIEDVVIEQVVVTKKSPPKPKEGEKK